VRSPIVNKRNYKRDSFYEERERLLDQLPAHQVEILLRDFKLNSERDDVIKPTASIEGLHEIDDDGGGGDDDDDDGDDNN
jgi:hypothetical protein